MKTCKKCNICGKSFRTKGEKKDHMKTCQKRCQWIICGKSIRTEVERNDHMRTCPENLKIIKQKMKKLKKKQALLSK